ncbi:hypothetical protein AXY_02280 [Amphibacillus xylanus NBRC 15112]|uniref:Uncharacterized protein n=1 Tax=Amphibacillus xylanus (strain ATCC 51415 / DSM 6626 / JCM 7361 / LMG 17667 / NBRC 15112 / Ep01) TaxID=698758 RepID=K0IVD2_AMPXN|nr:hypothetical protein AXY_02280 [Amphibacillus xylanus NBRC 15112]
MFENSLLENTLNEIALLLLYLIIMITVFMSVTAILTRLLEKVIPFLKHFSSFLLGLSGLIATYVWVQFFFD